jgi:hypothetical protein
MPEAEIESQDQQRPDGPNVIVFYDDRNEVQLGTNYDMHPGEMRLMLQVAVAKLELLEFRMMMRQAQQSSSRIIRPS